MKRGLSFAFGSLFVFVIIASVQALDTGTIFSVQPGTGYKCVYVSLPQDLGVSSVDKETETIIEVNKDASPWAETTYNKVILSPGTMNKNPVCFYYSEKKDGDFSFYNIHLSSLELGVSNSISGGICVSNYEDVDTGIEVSNRSDVCKLLSENADIIDLSFAEDPIIAKRGELLSKTLYITSYANIRIRLSIATNLQNDFGTPVVTTSSSKPMVSRSIKIKAPDSEGNYTMTIMAQVDGCNMKACSKQKDVVVRVSDTERLGFDARVIPQNINLKIPNEVLFRVVVSNQEATQNFTVEANSDKELTIEPKKKTFTVEKGDELTAVFSVTPGSENLYRLEFKVMNSNNEKIATAYLSIGELLTDAVRYAEDAASSNPSLKDQITEEKNAYEQKYNQTSYGEDIPEEEKFIETLDDLKVNNGGNGNGNNSNGSKPSEPEGFNWMLVAIPVIIIVAVVLIIFALKKAKTSPGQDYGYGGYGGQKDYGGQD